MTLQPLLFIGNSIDFKNQLFLENESWEKSNQDNMILSCINDVILGKDSKKVNKKDD